MLLMNVLLSQGMDKSQAQAHVNAQINQLQANSQKQQLKDSRNQVSDIRPTGSQHIASSSQNMGQQ